MLTESKSLPSIGADIKIPRYWPMSLIMREPKEKEISVPISHLHISTGYNPLASLPHPEIRYHFSFLFQRSTHLPGNINRATEARLMACFPSDVPCGSSKE